jgi:hypothetical protein
LVRLAAVEFGASPEEVAAVEDAFARAGLPVQIRAEVPLSGGPPTDLAWVVYVALGTSLTAFFAALGSAAGADAYPALKAWIARLREARERTPGRGEIQINSKDSQIRIPANDEAIAALQAIDLTAFHGYLRWDEQRRTWQSWDDDCNVWRDLGVL